MRVIPVVGIVAAIAYLVASRSYDADRWHYATPATGSVQALDGEVTLRAPAA